MTTRTRKTAIAAATGTAVLVASLAACNGQSSSAGQRQESAQQQQDQTSLEKSQPIPHYDWSQMRATAIDAQNIAADGTQTTSFFFQMGSRDPVFSCPSIGVPVPNTAQLSNPEQVATAGDGNGGTNLAPISQMDPDGVYSPSASSGTYVVCVNGSGKNYLMYWEGDVMSATAGATWDESAHQIQVTGEPTTKIHGASGK